jgi:RNA polymerase sigma factor (sigma-70 family)
MSVEDDRRRRFERLFELHYCDVKGFVLRRAPPASVDDAVAETFLIAWRRLDDIDVDPLPWLFGVARRVLANQRRAERRRFALVDRLRREPAAALPAVGVLEDRLAGALTALSPREREALLLIAWEGLEPGRAARVAGCTAGAFRARVHRARRHLSDLMDAPSGSGDQSPGGQAPTVWPKETR